MRKVRAFLLISFVALTACRSAPKEPAPPVLGTWKLQSLSCASGELTGAGSKRATDLNKTWEQYQNVWPDSLGQSLKIQLPKTAPGSHCRGTVASNIQFIGADQYEVQKTAAVYLMFDGPTDRRCQGAARNTDKYVVHFEVQGDTLTQTKVYEWFPNMRREQWLMNSTCENGIIVETYKRIPKEEYPIVK